MKPPFSYYGGKQRIASKIIPYIPKHTVYAEPFCGGATILFQKPWPNVTDSSHYREAINDTNSDVVNFFEVLKNEGEELCRRLSFSLYSQENYAKAKDKTEKTPMQKAEDFFINVNQSFAKRINGGWGTSALSGNDPMLYARKVDRLHEYIDRMRTVYIANEDALRFIQRWDSPHTFFYIDPPYPNTNQGHYSGYSIDDFQNLIDLLKTIKGSFILSCYDQGLDIPWKTVDFQTVMSAAKAKDGKRENNKRTERIWLHYTEHEVRPEIQKLYSSGKYDCFRGNSQIEMFNTKKGEIE